jgi:transposase-like protein
LGKHGNAIEIDESVFCEMSVDGKKKKIWVLGFYERGTKEARAVYIKDRTEDTLTQVILENVEVGTEIYTDFWRGYNGLKNFYQHRVVNKQRYGNGSSEFQTTNRVEHLWSSIKRNFMIYSTFPKDYLQMFLDEAIWRRKYKTCDDRIDFLIQLNQYTSYDVEAEGLGFVNDG